jgi:hypothetical protein
MNDPKILSSICAFAKPLSTMKWAWLDGKDLRLLVVEPGMLGEAAPDGTLRQDGRVISLRAWSPGAWYPVDPSDPSLVLTEFADPDGELVYLKAPVPTDRRFQPDELVGMTSFAGGGRSGVAEGFYANILQEDLTDRESAETLRRLQS